MRALATPLLFSLLALPTGALAGEALALHPENAQYFVYRGHPLVLVGSGEHYGAVLNPDFDGWEPAYFERLHGFVAAARDRRRWCARSSRS